MSAICSTCLAAPAVACHECVRALALMSFAGITRHPEEGEDCAICEAGAAAFCGRCLIAEVASRRKDLREWAGYRDIRWTRDLDRDAGTARVPLELLARLQEYARRGGWEG